MQNYEEKFDVSKGSIQSILCVKCKPDETRHIVMSSVLCSGGWDDGNNSYDQTDKYEIIQCLGCQTVSFRSVSSNSEDVDHDFEGNASYIEREILYPQRLTEKAVGVLDDWHIPSKIFAIYKETLQSLNARLPILAAMGLRALVEAVCKEREAKGGNLEKKINDLVEKRILTATGAEILHSIRNLGNEAAHEIKPNKPTQLLLAMEVVNHLLKEVYILPAEARSAFDKKE